ncbi:putative MYH7B protein, partial [Trypanosoma theileri]
EKEAELDSAREELRLLREQCDSSSAERQTALESAFQERETLQRELDGAREELRLLREQFSSTSAEKQAELDTVLQERKDVLLELKRALRQREETQEELENARKELELQRERASITIVEQQAELNSALEQREKVQKELENALREREEVRRELDIALEELRVLREQSNSSSAEQQAELESVVQQRGEVQRDLNAAHEELEKVKYELEELREERQVLNERCGELEKRCQAALDEKESDLRTFEEKLLVWKEKVKVAKAKDDQRIEGLEALTAAQRGDVEGLAAVLRPLLAALGLPPPDPAPLPDGRLDVAPLLESLNGAQAAVANGTARVTALETQLHDAEEKCAAAAAPEVVTELEQRNAQLEEKCELLRKEIKRQREAFQREKAQQDISTAGTREEGRATLRAAAGGVFEKDMLSLATQQSQRDNEIRQLRAQLQTLEKENAELKRECDHNNSVLAQYTKDIEVLKAKERVQLSIEYVRNVILQFLCCPNETVRLQMVPAIATVLEFTPKEKMEVQSANPACPRFH